MRIFIVWLIRALVGSSVFVFLIISGLVVVVLFVPGITDGILQACAPNSTSGPSGVVQAKAPAKPGSIPQNYLELYKSAGREWNIPWNVLAGIGSIESHHGTLEAAGVESGENFAGAGGPMQFLQSTFDRVKVDGNGDGKKSRYNAADAIFSAAKLLKVHIIGIGASEQALKARTLTAEEIRRSLYSYNHSWQYVNDVLEQASRYAGGHTVAPANYAAACSDAMAMSLGSGSFGQRIANAAAYYAMEEPGTPTPPSRLGTKVPYSWGGGTLVRPGPGICCSPGNHDARNTVGFDCSGLARMAVYVASNKRITLPRTTHAMWGSGKGVKVARGQLAPGDLVFFNGIEHMAIYYGTFNGKRWMVEALKTGTYVQFNDFDARRDFEGALRIPEPGGSPNVVPAMAPLPVHVGERPI